MWVDLQIGVLGEIRVEVDGVDVTPRAPKERSLFALLAINHDRVVAVDRLIDELWTGLGPDRGRRVLQVRIGEIRRLLARVGCASLLESVTPGYRLRMASDALDADRFALLLEHGRALAAAHDTLGAATCLREALGLWRGEALADARGSASLEAEALRLTDSRLGAIEDRIAAELADGCHQRLVPELNALVHEHPWRERLWEHRVVALYRSGRQTEALRACAEIRGRLTEELGVEPGPVLRGLEADVLAQRDTLDCVATLASRRVVPDPLSLLDATDGRRADAPANAEPTPPVQYVRGADGVHIAFQVLGSGPQDIVVVPGFVSELDNWWEAWSGRLLRRLASFSRVIVFDKRGMGLSDRPPNVEVDHWVEDIRTVLDAVGSERPAVLGVSAGGAVAILFAATHPLRTGPLILYGASPCVLTDDTDPYPSTVTAERFEHFVKNLEAGWGTGTAITYFCPSVADDPEIRAQFGQYERRSASPGAASAYLRALALIDVRPALSHIRAPTLVLHAQRDIPTPIEVARWTTAHIDGARLIELDTADHLIWFSEAIDTITDEVQQFVLGARLVAASTRALTTVAAVRTRAGAMTDFPEVRAAVARFGGRNVGQADTELLLAFDGPASAVRCAAAIVCALRRAGVPASAGVHSGEGIVVNGSAVAGEVVSTAQWAAALAGTSEIVVSSNVRDLARGSSLKFDEADLHGLRRLLD